MDDIKKEENSGGLAAAVIFLSISVAFLAGYNLFTSIMTDTLRHKCNVEFNAVPALGEELTSREFLISTDKPDPAYIQAELEKTNAQYNKLQKLFGCYFDN